MHYYAVFKKDNTKEINYYIGLDSHSKKIYFYMDNHFASPSCIYDLYNDGFEKTDQKMLPLLNGKVIMQSLEALENNHFPQSISWEG
jgi:hypothetical protein